MSRLIPSALTVLALNLLTMPVLLGEEEGNAQAVDKNVLDMVIESGPVEWILILMSIVGISVGIHRLITIKKEALVPDGLVDDVHAIFEEGVNDESVEEALNVVAGDPSMLGEVLAAALDKRDFGFESMAEAAEAVGTAEHNKYMSQINWLSLLAAIGPMLGLLGTVTGMIGAFMTMMSKGGTPDPGQLSGDIGGAMITTATGLIIAIPMMFFFFFLRARINKCVLEAGVLTGEVLDYFRTNN